jgi:hypothetical protein
LLVGSLLVVNLLACLLACGGDAVRAIDRYASGKLDRLTEGLAKQDDAHQPLTHCILLDTGVQRTTLRVGHRATMEDLDVQQQQL